MLLVTPPKQELVLLPTMKMIASGVIPELGLVLEDLLMTPTRVETRPSGNQTMERSTLKPCVMSLYNKTLAKCKWYFNLRFAISNRVRNKYFCLLISLEAEMYKTVG